MKYSLFAFVLISAICIAETGKSEKHSKALLRKLYSEVKKHGFPRIGYYDGAKLVDELQSIYGNVTTGIKGIQLGTSEFSEFNKELVFKNGIELIKALQIFYMKSLDSVDNVLDVLVEIRKQQTAANLVTGQAFINMYKAISEMDVEEDESFFAAVDEFLKSLRELNTEAVKSMYNLAKKHTDLQKMMEIHEEATFKIKQLCQTLTEVTDMPTSIGDILAKIIEPFVTLLFLKSLFG